MTDAALPDLLLYRDQRLVVANKPPGMPVHHSREHRDASAALVQTVRDLLGCRVNPVHRLDRPTSGIVLMAMDAEATAAYAAALAAQDAVKTYLCLVRGRLLPEILDVDRPLTHRDKGIVQPARTRLRAVRVVDLGGAFGPATLVEAQPRTGRRHQIRRHLSHLKHQVLGDTTYGKGAVNRYAREVLGIPRLFLHAARVELTDPYSGLRLVVDCPLPPDLAEPLARLPAAHPGPDPQPR